MIFKDNFQDRYSPQDCLHSFRPISKSSCQHVYFIPSKCVKTTLHPISFVQLLCFYLKYLDMERMRASGGKYLNTIFVSGSTTSVLVSGDQMSHILGMFDQKIFYPLSWPVD